MSAPPSAPGTGSPRPDPLAGCTTLSRILLVILVLSASCAPTRDREALAVTEVARMYLLADQEGDQLRLRSVLHSRAEVWSVQDGGRVAVSSSPTVRGHPFGGGGRMGEAGEGRILAVDVHGTAAMVKVELRVEGGRITQYLTLLKLEEGWRIVGSSAHWEEHRREGGTGG